jgi:hypothetical protein
MVVPSTPLLTKEKIFIIQQTTGDNQTFLRKKGLRKRSEPWEFPRLDEFLRLLISKKKICGVLRDLIQCIGWFS